MALRCALKKEILDRSGEWGVETHASRLENIPKRRRATKVRTRDNIGYIIPASELISNTIVNYSLSSPMIRIELPVGVSCGADPRVVERILLVAAEKEALVSQNKKPVVRFTEYGDSFINFELLIWIDVRMVPRRKVRSALYVKKPECPVLCTGMTGHYWFWEREPPSRLGFFF